MEESDFEYDHDDDDNDYNYVEEDYLEDEISNHSKDDPISKIDTAKKDTDESSGNYFSTLKNDERRSNCSKEGLLVPFDSYIIKSATDVAQLMNRLSTDLSSLLDIPLYETQALLRFHKWDKEKVIDSYFSDPDSIRNSVGLACNNTNNSLLMDKSVSGSYKCLICYEEGLSSSMAPFSLECKHSFCRSCWSAYLLNALKDGPTAILTRCPGFKCRSLCTRDVFCNFFGSGSTEVSQFDNFILRNFIEMSRNMRHCPAPRCERVCVGSGITQAKCLCGYYYCFKCGDEAHDPCSCAQLALWSAKCANESETANWILANTRQCPNCGARIEKNQGCNHMNCRVCKHDFCWICMGPWAEHSQSTGGFYKCNRFDSAAPSTSQTEAERAKAELDRYLHYYQRYHAHDSGLSFAVRQLSETDRRMMEAQELRKSTWMDVQFLKVAAETVIECRRVLKYTYVLGFYLNDGSPEKTLFEHHQEMLEKNTERLQEATEATVGEIERSHVVNLTRVTERFMTSLLQNISCGIVRIDEAGVKSDFGLAEK